MNKEFIENGQIKKGIYIPNIEAHWLYKSNKENGNYEIKEEFLNKLLNGKLDYSYELIENEKLLEGIEIKELDDKLYTLDVVNVKYNNKYTEKVVAEQRTTKELRDWTYENGFKFNGKELENWKRSTGKSREGENMFILNNIKNECLDWARMGLKFEGNVDIGSIRAYESLPLSSVIGECIKINPENILVIADFKSEFPWKMSKTYLEGEKLKTETIEVMESNSIWDGEGLLSNKIFEANEIINGKGVALLRNRLTKCAGFCCYIEKFFKKHCEDNGLDYETFEVEDMYGNKILAKNIELITTPSSIKIHKYNNEVCKKEGYKGEGAWLKYWKERCGTNFGVCKYEKPSHNCILDADGNVITYRNVLSYQHLNTIPFTKDELHELVQPEIKYVERLKTDLEFFLQEVNQEVVEDPEVIIDDEEENEFKIGANIDVTSAFIELSKRNPNFQNTQVFKDYRRNFISAYIKRLRAGKIHIDGADYAIACGNPIELLKTCVGEFDGTSVLNNNELYCSRFKDGEDVVGFRNPHILVSNVGVQVNKFVQEIEDYMKVTDNIVYLNAINYPIQSLYNGEDYDIDSNLLTNSKIIVGASKRIDNNITPIPYNGIENTGKNDKELTALNMSNVDHIICQNYIGSDINLSQEINSMFNNLRFNELILDEDLDKDYDLKKEVEDDITKELNELFDMVSKCSSISQVEIDKSKKQFEKLDVPKELEKMKTYLELVDNLQIRIINNRINRFKTEIYEVEKRKREELKNVKKKIHKINNILRINDNEKLTEENIKILNENLKKKNISKTEKREINKTLREDAIEKLIKKEVLEFKDELNYLEYMVEFIESEKIKEINILKGYIEKERLELKDYDSRRIKPYFFKFVGDNKSKKQRKSTNTKHRKELDRATKEEFAKNKGIKIEELDVKDKDLVKLLKANDKIQEKWEAKGFNKEIDTPMNWLELELDKVKNSKKIGTVQVIQLVKGSKHKANEETVKYIINNIRALDKKITGYKLNNDLKAKEKFNKIKDAKKEVVKNIRLMKLTKADIFGIMKASLNTTFKNGKVDVKSGIESISLEILFTVYGDKLLDMFCQNKGAILK